MKNYFFESFDGEKINCYEWKPKGDILGCVQIVHGLQEHGLRYKKFAEYLTKHGYLVLASDQRLHGLTAGDSLSKTKIKNVFPIMVKDQMLIADMLHKKYNKPLVVFGHSYGSFITQSFIQNYQKLNGAILCGSGFMRRLDTFFGSIASDIAVMLKGGEADAKLIEDMVINNYNQSFKGNGNWISANLENLKDIENDPLCGVPLCANFYWSMFKNIRALYDKKDISKIDKNMPILIASGKDDPVGQMGKSTMKLYKFYKECGLNAEIKLYENMRHEILNEDKNQIVYQDMLSFINNAILSSKENHMQSGYNDADHRVDNYQMV